MAIGDEGLPIIGAPQEVNNDSSKIIKFGKYTGVLFPEIYYQFVIKLHKEHPDLVTAMQLAQVNFQDGTAVAFLKEIFGITSEELPLQTPMEIGYKILYAHLEKRAGSRYLNGIAKENAELTLQSKLTDGAIRRPEDVGTPLFPSFEELKDKENHEIKYGRKEKK